MKISMSVPVLAASDMVATSFFPSKNVVCYKMDTKWLHVERVWSTTTGILNKESDLSVVEALESLSRSS